MGRTSKVSVAAIIFTWTVAILLSALLFVLCPSRSRAQTKVTFTKAEVKQHKLSPSVQDTYMVYTFTEHKGVLFVLLQHKQLKLKTDKMAKVIDLLKLNLEGRKKQIDLFGKELKQCNDSRKRITDKWKKTDKDLQMSKAGSWKPWVITAASILVAIVGVSFGGYYYKKAK
jgi:hypothetical protein